MSEDIPAPDEIDPSEVDPSEVALAPLTIRWWRVALFFLGAATVVSLIGLGSEGRASGLFGALGAGAERISNEVGNVIDGVRYDLQRTAASEPDVIPDLAAPTGSFSSVIVVEGSAGAAASIVLAVADPDGSSTLVVLPPNLATTVPGYGDFPLAETARFEDAALTAVTITNMLGVRVDVTIGLTAEELTAAIGSPMTVDLPAEVVLPSGDGGTILAERGETDLPASLVTAVIVTQGESDDLAWLERQGAVWQAIFESDDVGRFIDAIESRAGPGEDGAAALRAAAAGTPLTVSSPNLSAIGVGTDEQLALRGTDAEEFVLSRLSHLLIREGDRPRVEVLNGNGRTQTTRLVAETLVLKGFRVVKTDNADSFDYRESRVIAQGRSNRLPGAEIVELLGVGELELEIRAPSGVVDVSIIVGQDIPIGEGS